MGCGTSRNKPPQRTGEAAATAHATAVVRTRGVGELAQAQNEAHAARGFSQGGRTGPGAGGGGAGRVGRGVEDKHGTHPGHGHGTDAPVGGQGRQPGKGGNGGVHVPPLVVPPFSEETHEDPESGEVSPDDASDMSNVSELTDKNLEAHNQMMMEQALHESQEHDDGTLDTFVMQRYYTLGRSRVSTLPLLNASDEVTKTITSRPTKAWRKTASRDSALSRSSLSSIAESDAESYADDDDSRSSFSY